MSTFHRLPTNIKPSHYKIHLQPNFVNFTCNGKVEVTIEVFEPTSSITLNSAEIIIKSAVYISNNDKKQLQSTKIETNAENEIATITFSEKLPVEKSAVLHLEFQAEINDKLKGIYRSKYIGSDGNTKYAIVTQFAATDARRCFPCWDEPALKSKFDIILTVPKDLVALSNMPVKSQTSSSSDAQLQTVAFDTSPIMSTYLVAIVIGEFDFIEDCTKDDVFVRVYTPKGKQEQGKFALEVATKVLPYYKSYFDIPYPLPKMDLIAIADISVGAMENWGLVTYRETRLLVDPQNTSEFIKQKVALVVGHELAHQWFGNLVTMEWWTHVWLNEGYASFVEFLSVNLLFPEYDIWTQFVTDTYIKALELDALKNSHPIEVPVNHPSEINEIFDDISYNKGASIIRMLYSYVGEDNFRKGMSLYLKKYKYSNAQTEDLWRSLEKASNKPVQHVMSTWTKQKGFPFLNVSEVASSDPNKRTLRCTQQKFLADGTRDEENSLWVIPMTVSSSANPEKLVKEDLMDTKTKDIEFEGISKNSWLKVNSGTVGVYRTAYSNDLLEAFVPAIQNRSLPPLDRLGLLDDLSALSQAGHVSAGQVLKFMQAFKNENNYTVWFSIMNCLDKIETIISHLEINEKFKTFGCLLTKNIYSHLGWDKNSQDGHLTTLFRALIISKMISFEDKSALEEAKRRFQDHVFGKVILPPDLRSAVYRAALSAGNVSTFDTLMTIYRSTDLNEEKTRILGSLGATKDENLLRRALEFSLSSEVKSQDTIFVISSVTSSYKGRVLAWQFFKDNYDTLMERCKSGFLLTKLIKSLTQHFITVDYAQEIKSFFDEHPTPGSERNVQQSIETIKLNSAWLQRDKDSIEEFLKLVQ